MTTETTAQRREKARAELVRALEKVTREVVEAEHFLAQKREEQTTFRDRLLVAVGGVRKRRLSNIPERIVAVARVVNDAPNPLGRADVAKALNISPSNAGMRLTLALGRNLIERVGRGLYGGVGRGTNGAATTSAASSWRCTSRDSSRSSGHERCNRD